MTFGEFEFIDRMRARFGLTSVGDDCAVLPMSSTHDQVITADLLIEDVDFAIEWTTPEMLGHKALAVSLSDIAAMGAEPTSALLSIGVPKSLWNAAFLDGIYAGWHRLASQFGVELVGGDVSRSNKFVMDSIVLGQVSKGTAILRSGAKPGNAIYVSGTLGAASGGLALIRDKRSDIDQNAAILAGRQLGPTPQLGLAKSLHNLHVPSAMIDVSDGLSSDLAHLCRSSGVGARIYADQLPIEPALHQFFDPSRCLDMALNGGEDFELLFTSEQKNFSYADLAPVTRIGEVTASTDIIELISGDDVSRLVPGGYTHF